MATGVGRGGIYLTSFNSPTPKTPDRRMNLSDISYNRKKTKKTSVYHTVNGNCALFHTHRKQQK